MEHHAADTSFQGWDITPATFGSSYLVMFVGTCLALMMYRQFGQTDQKERLPYVFATFLLLAALSYGFAGIAIHVLATFEEEGTAMSTTWFSPHSEWLVPWTIAMFLSPLASSCLLGTGLAFAKVNDRFIIVAKCFGLIISIIEVVLCVVAVNATGTASVYWGLLVTIIGLVMVFVRGCDDIPTRPAIILSALGFATLLVGYFYVVVSPMVCVMNVQAHAIHTRQGTLVVKAHDRSCWMYSDDFNQNAHFHILFAIALVFLHFGISRKACIDRDHSYRDLLRTFNKGAPRCCGC